MKIATWNLERPNVKCTKRNNKILEELRKFSADILILTETNSCIDPGSEYVPYATDALHLSQNIKYEPGENRTTIWTRYSLVSDIETYDKLTTYCVKLNTPHGDLIIYGTIIGIFGNREPSFKSDLEKQIADWREISKLGALCIAGDFNISFGDNYYFRKEGREKITQICDELEINNLTKDIPENVDHIAVSQSFIGSAASSIELWNEDKALSDHIGVCVTLIA